MDVNDRQKRILGIKVKNYFGNDLNGKTFAMWGLAFKPETDDIRDAPALDLIDELLAAGAKVKVFDPEAMANVRQLKGDTLHYATSPYDAVEGADALLLVTEWSEFRNPDFDRVEKLMKQPCIFDGRNVFSLDKMAELNFYYESMGRKVINGKK